MKKKLLFISITLFSLGVMNAQNLVAEGFLLDQGNLPTGWTQSNLSSPAGTDKWGQGDFLSFFSQDGGPAYTGIGYGAALDGGTISAWLFAPSLSLKNGDVVSFYTRTGNNSTGGGNKAYPDRLQMLIGVGANPSVPVGATGLGGYTVVTDVNPNYTSTGFPNAWTKYSYTVNGVPTETPCTIAFRYFVENTTLRGDYIGLDTFSIDRPTAGTEEFFASNFSIQPNPINEVFNLSTTSGTTIQNVKLVDVNGRIVLENNFSGLENIQMNVSELNTGLYFVKVQSELGIGTSRIIKN